MADDPKKKKKPAPAADAEAGSLAAPPGTNRAQELTDEEYNAQAQAALKSESGGDSGGTAQPEPESPVKKWWNSFNAVMSKQRDPAEIVRGAARGVVNAAVGTAQSVAEFGTEMSLPGKGRGAGEVVGGALNKAEDATLGKRPDDGLANFTESAIQFATGFAGADLILPGSGVVKGLAKGALVDYNTFEPYEAQLAELAARSGVPGLKQLGGLLSVNGDDPTVIARAKRAAAGAIPGVVFDAVKAGATKLRAAKVLSGGATGAEKKAAEAALEESSKTLTAIADGTHVPEDSHVKVVPTEEGFTIEHTNGTDPMEGVTGSHKLTFHDEAEAVQQAGTANYVIQDQLNAGKIDLDHEGIAKAIEDGVPNEAPITASAHNTVEQDMELVKALSESIIEKKSALEATTGGSITIEQAKQVAKDTLGQIPEEQLHGTIKSLLKANPESQDIVALAADMVLGRKGQEIVKLHDIVDARPHDPIAMQQLVTSLNNYFELRHELRPGESAAARRLRFVQEREAVRAEAAGKEVAPKADAPKTPKEKPQLPEVAGMKTRDASQTVVDEANAKLYARMFKLSDGTPRDMDAVVRASVAVHKGGAARKVLEVFTNFLLSGPPTWATVITSGQALSLFEPAVKMTAGAIGGDTAMIREGVDTLYGLYSHLGDNIKTAAMAMREGRSIINPAPSTYAIGGITGKVIRSPGNIMMGLDEFTRVSNYRAIVRAKSLRVGREAGLEGAALAQRVANDLEAAFDPNTKIATIPQALKYADVPTLSAGLTDGSFGRALQNFTNDAFVAKMVVPFVRASANIFDYVWQSAPALNQFNKTAKAALDAGGEEAARVHARSLLATTVGMYAYLQAKQGNLTGKGPSDPDLRKAWLQDNQPYSIRVGNHWVSYNRLDPLATPLGLVADLHVFGEELGHEHMDVEKMTMAITGALVANMASKTYLRGIFDFSDAWSKGDPNAVGRYLRRQVSSLAVPTLVDKLNPDPYYREVETMADAIKAKLPYFSKDLDARYNFLGEKEQKAPGLANRAANPFTVRDVKTSPVEQELLSIGKGLAPAPDKLNGIIDLHDKSYADKPGQPSPYTRMMELIRNPGDGEPSLRDAMLEKIKDSDWNELSDGTDDFRGGRKWLILAGVKERYEQRALRQVREEYPKLDDHISGVLHARGAAIKGGEAGQAESELLNGPVHR